MNIIVAATSVPNPLQSAQAKIKHQNGPLKLEDQV